MSPGKPLNHPHVPNTPGFDLVEPVFEAMRGVIEKLEDTGCLDDPEWCRTMYLHPVDSIKHQLEQIRDLYNQED